jgi:diguanylate cyclase (GGDEF)-like protein
MAVDSSMQSVASLDLVKTTVGPEEKVGDIRFLARSSGPRSVAVVHSDEVIGIIETNLLLRSAPEVVVRELMEVPPLRVDGSAHVRRVAADFLTHNLEAAPVYDGDKFLGLVTIAMLLREVGRSWDPLTGLGWSDRLREWGIARLRETKEVTVLFIDLDDFGSYNKRFGHIVGDYVLQVMASTLREYCSQGTDILVRFGGDEFAIATIRPRPEAEDLASNIKRGMSGLTIDQQTEPVRFSIGIFGGRRSIERDHVHYAATMDNLINLASKECIAQKPAKNSVS